MPEPDPPQHQWVETDEDFRAVLAAAAAAGRYAFDTEFHRERTYYPHLALLQIGWDGGIALVDPYLVDLAALADLFRADVVAVAHAADQDLEVLHHACGAVPARLFDTQLAAGFVGLSTPSLANLAQEVAGVRLPKGDRLTDWTTRPLTAAQRHYAAGDVAYLLEIYDDLTRRLEERGRLDWAWEECRVQLGAARPPQDPATAWWKLKDARSLRGAARGVAQEVAAWRERRAAELDRPPRMVLADLAILGMAHRPPGDERQLRQLRGVEARHLGGGAAADILAAVERGRRLPSDAIRAPSSDDLERRLRPAITLVSAWISQLARDLGLDTAILATRADLVAFLSEAPGARLGHGWRHDLVGEPIRRLVAGEAALAFRSAAGDLVLEERSHRPC